MKREVNFLDCQASFEKVNSDAEQDVFQLLFLDTENQRVEAWETNFIAFDDLINRLRVGESVFISPKKHNREDSPVCLDEDNNRPLYYKRI